MKDKWLTSIDIFTPIGLKVLSAYKGGDESYNLTQLENITFLVIHLNLYLKKKKNVALPVKHPNGFLLYITRVCYGATY